MNIDIETTGATFSRAVLHRRANRLARHIIALHDGGLTTSELALVLSRTFRTTVHDAMSHALEVLRRAIRSLLNMREECLAPKRERKAIGHANQLELAVALLAA